MTPRDLEAMRLRGQAPDLLVLSVIGRLRNVPAPVMVVTGREDPRLFAGLHVVIAHGGERPDHVIELADRLMRAGVPELEAWSVFEGLWVSIVSLGQKYLARVTPAFTRIPA